MNTTDRFCGFILIVKYILFIFSICEFISGYHANCICFLIMALFLQKEIEFLGDWNMKQLQEQINSLSSEEQELHKELIQECLEGKSLKDVKRNILANNVCRELRFQLCKYGRVEDFDRLFNHLIKWLLIAKKDRYDRPDEQ